jgi:hypothetical protein
MYGMLIFVVLTVFIAGLMVGRTPEYLGKKVEAYDVQMAMLWLLIFPVVILGLPRFRCWRFGLSSDCEPRAAWALGDSVRVHVGGRKQRLGVCGDEREYALVQLDAGNHHAGRAVPDDRADAGGGGEPGDARRLRRLRWARFR